MAASSIPEIEDRPRVDSCRPPSAQFPFWNTNVPPHLHTPTCPSYLTYAYTDLKDRATLSTPDSLYRRSTWEEVQCLIRENRLQDFQRVPSELRMYREYCEKLKGKYGSVIDFVIKERLRWDGIECKGSGQFEDEEDYTILQNDFPYGIDERIVHLIVWPKFDLPADPVSEKGDLAPETRILIQGFVDRTFGTKDVIWFKNWTALKSIRAVEHFHVMLFEPDADFVERITKGDVPLWKKVKRDVSGREG